MIDTTETAGQLVQAYYDILEGGTAAFDEGQLRALLASDLVFEGPIAGRRIGAGPFVKGVSGFVRTVRRIDMVQQLCTGDQAATLYDAELPGGTLRFAEFFQMAEGKIQSLRLLFDAAQYRARGGA